LARTTDRFWKIRCLFGNQNDIFTKFYSLVEHLAVHKDAVLFDGKIVFQALYLRKMDAMLLFYTLCDMADCTYKITI